MSIDFRYGHPTPPESESRSLDAKVMSQEMPYGYQGDGPPADTGDYNERKSETTMQSRPPRNHG
jgi:hypothetical protein